MSDPTYAEVTAAMETNTVCRCNGTGRVVHEFQDIGPPVPIGDGYTISPMRGHVTELCPCRRLLPRRYGKVSWWTEETVHSDDIELGGLHSVGISVRREVPISEDNYPLHRTLDNCYFQPLAELSIEDTTSLTADNLRELAAWLIAKADIMEELDKPYSEETHP